MVVLVEAVHGCPTNWSAWTDLAALGAESTAASQRAQALLSQTQLSRSCAWMLAFFQVMMRS